MSSNYIKNRSKGWWLNKEKSSINCKEKYSGLKSCSMHFINKKKKRGHCHCGFKTSTTPRILKIDGIKQDTGGFFKASTILSVVTSCCSQRVRRPTCGRSKRIRISTLWVFKE